MEKQLVKKLANVMKEVKYIEKKGFNSFSKYKYATESDVAEKVREVLAEQNVIMLPDVVEHSTREHVSRKGNTEYIATVRVKFTFIDGDTGEELSIHSAGEGQDSGDKAVYKAITGAQKYALMKAFMIPTGDDPEADTKTDQNNAPSKPIKQKDVGLIKSRALKFAGMRGKTENEVYEVLNINDITNLSEDDGIAVIEKLDAWIKKADEEDAKQTTGA